MIAEVYREHHSTACSDTFHSEELWERFPPRAADSSDVLTLRGILGSAMEHSILPALVLVSDSPGWLKYTKDAASTVQSVATIIALLIGAWWVLRRRRTYPRANFRHIVSHVPLDDDTYLVRLTVAVENIGDVLLQLEESVAGIKRLVPVPEYLRPALQGGVGVESWEQSEIRWPFIDTRRRNRTGTTIESGESAAFDFDLFVPRMVRFVLVYSYFRNIAKPEGQGWNTSTFYELQNTQS